MTESGLEAIAARLSRCIPFDTLGQDHVRAIARLARVERLKPGQTAFWRGDMDHDAVYLLSGRVDLIAADEVSRTVVAGTEKARYALSHLKPRRHEAVAHGEAVIARIDNAVLDRLLTFAQVSGYEVIEFSWPGSDQSWLMTLLQTPLFHHLPALVIQQVLARLEPVAVAAGETVISCGERPDYYYLIHHGFCEVWRSPPAGGPEALVAELTEGQGFGEEALLVDVPRNATVRMATKGMLLRLARDDFNQLLRATLVRWAEPGLALELLEAGARLLDVRLESEHGSGSFPGSINFPLHELRVRASALDGTLRYLVICDTGNRSSAAAFLLTERGYDVLALRGGLGALRQARSTPKA